MGKFLNPICSLNHHQSRANIIWSAVLIFNLILTVVLFIQRSIVDQTNSSKMITNFYLADTIRRLCPEDQVFFRTDQGILTKENNKITVRLNNGYERIFKDR